MTMRIVVNAVALCLLSSAVTAQDGDGRCACAPGRFEFMFDFLLSCTDSNLGGQGIESFDCVVAGSADNVPAEVTSVVIQEMDANGDVLKDETFDGSFTSGSTVVYQSISSEGQVPVSMELLYIGTNTQGETIMQDNAIAFTNDCDMYPVMIDFQIIGWTFLSSIVPPNQGVCPNAPPTDPSQTPAPSSMTPAPSIVPMPSVPTPPTPAPTPAVPTAPSTQQPTSCSQSKGSKSGSRSKGSKGKKGYASIFDNPGAPLHDDCPERSSKSSKGGKKTSSSSSKSSKSYYSVHHPATPAPTVDSSSTRTTNAPSAAPVPFFSPSSSDSGEGSTIAAGDDVTSGASPENITPIEPIVAHKGPSRTEMAVFGSVAAVGTFVLVLGVIFLVQRHRQRRMVREKPWKSMQENIHLNAI